MRQERILRINPGTYLIHTGPLREHFHLIGSLAVLVGNETELVHCLEVEFTLLVGNGEQHLDSYILRLKTAKVEHHLTLECILC